MGFGNDSGGQDTPAEDDPFARATGRVGAAPAPSWGQESAPPTNGAPPPDPGPPKAAVPQERPIPWASSVYSETAYSTGDRTTYGRSGRRRRYGYSRGYRYSRGYSLPVSPLRQRVTVLAVGLPTLGMAWLIGAIVHWRDFVKARAGQQERSRVRPLFWWAVGFSALTALAILFWVAVAVAGHSSSSDSAALPPSASLTRSLGQSATLSEPVAPGGNTASVPVTVTFSDFVYPTTLPNQVVGGNQHTDTATGLLKVCATTRAVDPIGVLVSLSAQAGGNFVSADVLSAGRNTPLGNTLRPGECASGLVGFPVPRGTSVQAVQFGLFNSVAWSVPASLGSGG